jgi:hypothetical protein
MEIEPVKQLWKENMLEHQKKVIENVSHNDEIYNKEIEKSREWLTENDFKSCRIG